MKPFHQSDAIVLINMHKNHHQLPYLLNLARERDWRFFDLNVTKGGIPTGLEIRGAILDALPTSPLAESIRKLGCPVVRIGRMPHPLDHLQPVVTYDLQLAGRLAANHFAARGFQHLGYVRQSPWANGRLLYDGFNSRAKELKKDLNLLKLLLPERNVDSETIDDYRTRRQAIKDATIRKWLLECPKPLGLFAYHDGFAIHAHLLCLSLGLDVPGEVSILSFGNTPQCETALLPISSIDQGLDTAAQKAVELLDRMIDGYVPDPPCIMVPPTGVVLRQSTDVLAVSDPKIAKALNFIWANMAYPISVQNVADAVDLPKRSLVRNFKRCLGRTVNEELRRKRLEKSCELLRTSSMTIAEIVSTVGFSSKAYFHKRFQEEFDMTPLAFRVSRPKKAPASPLA